MAKGKARTKLLDHSAGLVEGSAGGPSWDFLYQKSLIRHPDYNIGDRVALPDGRVFRYGKSSDTAIITDLLCSFAEDEVQGYEVLKNNQAVGDKEVVFTGAAHAALDEDELRGGYIVVYHSGGGGFSQFRGIVGNPASALNANITVYLDASLDHEVVALTTAAELWYNPYAALKGTTDDAASAAGKPVVNVAVADTYFWIQTWGPCWLSPQIAGFQAANKQRSAVKRNDGSIVAPGAAGALDMTQIVGFLINEGLSSGPLFMLTISP